MDPPANVRKTNVIVQRDVVHQRSVVVMVSHSTLPLCQCIISPLYNS